MKIKVVYLGGSREQSLCAEEEFPLSPGARLEHAVEVVSAKHPALEPYLQSVRWAVNYEFVDLSHPLSDGDEVALLPPVQGGLDRFHIGTEALDINRVMQELQDPRVGASLLFFGTVRNHSRGKEVQHLEYEAYVPMVERQLAIILRDLEVDYPETLVVIHHRYGGLEIGDISIIIGTASAHRDEAYRASRAAIERIKIDLPIWKKELTTDGAEWTGWGGG